MSSSSAVTVEEFPPDYPIISPLHLLLVKEAGHLRDLRIIIDEPCEDEPREDEPREDEVSNSEPNYAPHFTACRPDDANMSREELQEQFRCWRAFPGDANLRADVWQTINAQYLKRYAVNSLNISIRRVASDENVVILQICMIFRSRARGCEGRWFTKICAIENPARGVCGDLACTSFLLEHEERKKIVIHQFGGFYASAVWMWEMRDGDQLLVPYPLVGEGKSLRFGPRGWRREFVPLYRFTTVKNGCFYTLNVKNGEITVRLYEIPARRGFSPCQLIERSFAWDDKEAFFEIHIDRFDNVWVTRSGTRPAVKLLTPDLQDVGEVLFDELPGAVGEFEHSRVIDPEDCGITTHDLVVVAAVGLPSGKSKSLYWGLKAGANREAELLAMLDDH